MRSHDVPRDEPRDQTADWLALGAEWRSLAADLDQRAAEWSALAALWNPLDARSRHALEQAHWACERTRQVAAWARHAARAMLALTGSRD